MAPALCSPHLRDRLTLPPSGSKQGNLLLVFAPSCCSASPNNALPEFLVWRLINFYWLRSPRTQVGNKNIPKESAKTCMCRRNITLNHTVIQHNPSRGRIWPVPQEALCSHVQSHHTLSFSEVTTVLAFVISISLLFFIVLFSLFWNII